MFTISTVKNARAIKFNYIVLGQTFDKEAKHTATLVPECHYVFTPTLIS